MIRSVAVSGGDTPYHEVAHRHALRLAGLFQAHLRGVVVWEPEDVESLRSKGVSDDPADLAAQKLAVLEEEAAEAGLAVETRFRGEGLRSGLLAEARECDVLVVGMPTEGVAQDDPLAKALLHDELPLLRQGESAVLAVCCPPSALGNVLLAYHGGLEGKAALRLGGHIARRAAARVHVLSLHADIAEAEGHAAVAEEYLAAYELPAVETRPVVGSPDSKAEILEAAENVNADLIVIGDEPYGILERLFGDATAERVAMATHIPVLIAR